MKRNTATQLLRLLSEEELRKLSKFLHSPYFNYSQPIFTLFECLRKWHPDYEEKRIRPQMHWKKIFPEKPFSEQSYWALNFKLHRLIERFLAIEKMEGNEMEFKKQLIKSYADRNAHLLFENDTKYLIEKIDGQPCQDIHSYSESLWLKHDYFFNSQTDKYGGALYAVEDVMEDLDRFYLLAKLRFSAEIKNREKMFSKKNSVQLLEETVAASKKYEEENPAFLMYKMVLDLFVPEKAELAFEEGIKLLKNNFSFISKHDQNEVMLNLRNYAVRQINKGNTLYFNKSYELQKLGIEYDLVLVDGKISESNYGNFVKIGCLVKEFEWTEKFITDYSKYLDADVREDGNAMSTAVLMFAKGDYNGAINLLERHEFAQILYQLESRTLLIKAWFEHYLTNRDAWDLLTSKLEAAEKYYRRDIYVSEQKKHAHINFVLAVKRIFEFAFQLKTRDEINKLMDQYIGKNKNIVSKSWLLEKIEMISIEK